MPKNTVIDADDDEEENSSRKGPGKCRVGC